MAEGCKHHWLMSAPVNNFENGTVTIHQRCKKCGDEGDLVTAPVDAYSLDNRPYKGLEGKETW